ncbi:hypothetical protein CPB85DRAFT_1238589 [Mucidula mucida]|nr:hypothetical protein CPB85DRAFT_1238589 [Mucidula mucida]
MHWQTYCASKHSLLLIKFCTLTLAVALCHHDSWRQDLNVELLTPFTKNIASLWGKLFKTDLFQAFQEATLATIKKLLVDFESSATFVLSNLFKSSVILTGALGLLPLIH